MCGLSKKKIPYLHLIDEAIGLLNNEMRIVKWRIKYPEQFKIMEIVSGLFLSKCIIYQNCKPVHLTDLGKAFEWLFNIKLGDYHQKHEDVIKRKSTKLTEFLNGLIALIRKEHENKGYR